MVKILVVDDDESILDAISTFLEDQGYRVETLNGGEDMDVKIKNFAPDLILLDHLMKGISGQKICTELKSHRKTKKIPVIMVSAHPSIKKIVFKCGAEAFLTKPFESRELLDIVQKYTGSSV